MSAGLEVAIGGLGLSNEDVANFRKTLVELRNKSGTSMRTAMRRGTIALIKSLRDKKAGTKESPKVLPRSNFRLGNSDPKVITVEGKERRRVVVSRFNRAGKLHNESYFIPLKTKLKRRRMNVGMMGKQTVTTSAEDKTAILREARSKHGAIYNVGLARETWGWFMHALFGKADGYADAIGGRSGHQRVRIQRGKIVDCGMSEKREPMEGGIISLEAPIKLTIDIINKLSYIREALYPGSLERAVRKANNLISAQLKHWDKIHGV